MPNTIRAILFASACLMAGCSSIQSHGEFVPAAPYAELRTFSFAPPEGPPGGYGLSPRSATVVEQMKPLVAEALEKKGYTAANAGEGDIIIAIGAGRREAEKHIRVSWRITNITGEEFEDRDFVEGGIVIDAFDRSGGQIWHGAARTEIDPQKPNAERLRRTVDAALARFPAHPAR